MGGSPPNLYGKPDKRRRATAAEMEERASFLIAYAHKHAPVSVRGLYYRAEVEKVPGIDKTDAGYDKVQSQVLKLRRQGRLDYDHISDATRWMRKPRSFNSIKSALQDTARTYRKQLWTGNNAYVEVWLEKDALAGVIYPITGLYDVPLMVTRGFSSETFAYEAVASRAGKPGTCYIYYLGDFDRAGRDAARSLHEKLARFGREFKVDFVFEELAVTLEQIREWNLPTRPPKRLSGADKAWPHDFACELDAVPPDDMRALVEAAINRHLPQDQLQLMKIVEEDERKLLHMFANHN
jgi:hypothetical protein